MQPSHSEPSEPEQEPEELVRFREQWRKELERKRAQPASVDEDQATTPTVSSSGTASQAVYTQQQPGPSSHTIAGAPTASSLQTSHGTTAMTPGLTSAIALYRRAVQHEQQSELDDALRLYRQAFRMNPNVDKAYHNVQQQNLAAEPAPRPGLSRTHKKVSSVSSATGIDDITRGIGALSTKHTASVVTGTLAGLLEGFPQDLIFESEDERESVILNKLPDELLVLVLRNLDSTSIERFAAVNRKARVVSLDSSIWRELVEETYNPPQILHELAMEAVVNSYLSDYRRVYIEHPRVRLDGVYIAVCHYIRPGLSENTWVNISHLITYHRYLRFFPNGQVLSLLANEELDPQQVIPILKPTLRMKGLFIGDWHLDEATVVVTNLVDASGKPPLASSPASTATPGITSALGPSQISYSSRYVFQMTLTLRSRPLGRWNKLDFKGYDSVDLQNGDIIPLSLKHERAFWFSKVRSYGV